MSRLIGRRERYLVSSSQRRLLGPLGEYIVSVLLHQIDNRIFWIYACKIPALVWFVSWSFLGVKTKTPFSPSPKHNILLNWNKNLFQRFAWSNFLSVLIYKVIWQLLRDRIRQGKLDDAQTQCKKSIILITIHIIAMICDHIKDKGRGHKQQQLIGVSHFHPCKDCGWVSAGLFFIVKTLQACKTVLDITIKKKLFVI